MVKKSRGNINSAYLKELRVQHGFTPRQMANKLGVGLSTYYKWEDNTQTPSILKIQLLQKVYKGLDYNKLLSLDLKNVIMETV